MQENPPDQANRRQQDHNTNNLNLPQPVRDPPKEQRKPREPRRERTSDEANINMHGLTDSQFQILTVHMSIWKQLIIDAFKNILPKCLTTLINTMAFDTPIDERHEIIKSQVNYLANKVFDSDASTSEESDEDDETPDEGVEHPPGAQGPAIKNILPASFVAGQRRTKKKKKKPSQALG